jgi:hypothetical protein
METYITRSDFKKWRSDRRKHPRMREPGSAASSCRAEEILLAQLQFPGGQRISDPNPTSADIATRTLIYTSDCTVFGSCLTSGPFVARPDILIRHGAELRIIEVATQGSKQWEWQDVFDDLVFDLAVIEACCPNVEIIPQLLVVLGASKARNHSDPYTTAPVPICLSPMRGMLGGLLEETVTDMDRMLKDQVRCGATSHRNGLGEMPQ